MKRFTETAKWDDPWFRSLAGVHKLVFLYVIDRCDNAGFWEVDEEAAAFHTKLEIKHVQGAWKGLERGLKGASGWVWVKNFLRHQKNEVINSANPAHRQIIGLLKEQQDRFSSIAEFSSFIAPYKGLLRPIGTGTGTGTNGKGVQRKGKDDPVIVTDPLALRVGKIFGRRNPEQWTIGQFEKFQSACPMDDEIEALEGYYAEEKAKGEGDNGGKHRRDMETMMNHFRGELDRARSWKNKPQQKKSLGV